MDADRIRAAAQLLVDAALASGPPKPAGPPFARLWERYFREDARHLDTAKDLARIGRTLCGFWGERPAGGITTEDAENYRDRRAETKTRLLNADGTHGTVSAQTIDNELSVARRCLNWAVDARLLPFNPLARVKLARPNNVRKTKVKSEEDLQRLLEACDPMLRALVLLLIDCGPRRMEAISMEWVQLEFRDGRAVAELWETKTEKRRTIRLSMRTLAAILKLPRDRRWVFCNPKTGRQYSARWLYEKFLRAVEAAGLTGVAGERICFHTLRHSFAYIRRTRDKVSRQAIMKQGGWVDPKVFDRYGIPDDDELDDMYKVVDRNNESEQRRLRKAPRRAPEHTRTDMSLGTYERKSRVDSAK